MAGPEIRLLGPLEVRLDGHPVELPGQRVQTLLVMLALAGGRVVSFERLAAGIWDDDPPVHLRGALQTSVGRLRRALGEAVVLTAPSGYRLGMPPAWVDVVEFRHRIAEAEASTALPEQRQLLQAALDLWPDGPTGEALTDWLRRHASPELVEQYLWAFERRVDLDLADGLHGSLIGELRSLTDRYPLRETLWERLLRALLASGRRAEALDRYETLRAQLVAELGVEPSGRLRALHRRMLQEAEDPLSP